MISHRKTPDMRYAHTPLITPHLLMPIPSKHPAISPTLTAGDLLAPSPTLVYHCLTHPLKAQKFDSNQTHKN